MSLEQRNKHYAEPFSNVIDEIRYWAKLEHKYLSLKTIDAYGNDLQIEKRPVIKLKRKSTVLRMKCT
jgi:hypothetical protein